MAGIRLILLMALVIVAASKGNVINSEALEASDKPVFDVTTSRSMDEPPSITVSFANGVKDELILTHYKMNENSAVGCNYLGRLKQSPSSSIAVTGCLNNPGDRMEVTLISEHNTNSMFAVDFFGNTEIIKTPFEDGATSRAVSIDRDDSEWQRDGDEEINAAIEAAAVTAKAVTIPSKLKAVIKFGYEQGLKNALGGQDFGTWIQGVFTHTQAHYRRTSLGTEIEFEVQGSPLYKSGAIWTADDNLENARHATIAANLNGVATMSWWCNAGGANTAGIAYVGTLCMEQGYGTNLNEAQNTQVASGYLLAHELGHNFGMNHDFHKSHGGQGGPCNGKGIMSYGSFNYNKWSTCSRSDWEQHYASRNWGSVCLENLSGTTGGPKNQGKDCWSQCGKNTKCWYCGTGLCCRKTDWLWWNWSNSECSSSKGGKGYHACVAA